jgi:hypothetical protein
MKAITCALLLLTIPVTVQSQCQPEKMLRIVVRDESPTIPKGHFAGEPKTIYRLGSKLARVEEQPDTAQQLHGLFVVNEPDAWIVNLVKMTGQHVVDTEPPFRTVFPLFPKEAWPPPFPAELERLEFGCEIAFFDGFKAPLTELSAPDGKMVKQAVGIGEWTLVLLRTRSEAPPSVVFLFRADKIVSIMRYLEYRPFQQPDMTLFQKPPGVAFTD